MAVVSSRKKRQSKRRMDPDQAGPVPVNVAALAPFNSYGEPDFVRRARRAEARRVHLEGSQRKKVRDA